MAFTHLHVHTEYSLLDGAARIKDLMAHAKELGMDSIAITDHGVMFGVVDFYKEARKQGLKPIIGCEVYTAARTLYDKNADMDKKQGHLVLLAKNNNGYKNLMKIVSKGFVDGFYYKPRIDKSVLREYSEGIIALSACLAGDVQRKFLNGDYEGGKQEALDYLQIFGEGNYYLELQNQGLEDEERILPLMEKLHEETGIPFVATNDVHYVRREDAKAHDVLLCIQTAATIEQEERMRFSNDQFYLKSEEEMRRLFPTLQEACDNTSIVAGKCNVEFEFGKLHLPEFKAPNGKTNKEYLRELCEKGVNQRYEVTGSIRKRLEYELDVIEKMGYVEYFLIVWDFINYAKENNIMVGPGRGSAAGSIVAYSLRITDIDPIKYGLIFERFLNPERVSMPDIDIDFCYERREEVIDYVKEKYGVDKVAQIITFGTMKAKQAVRDVGRVLNLSYAETDIVAKAIPNELKMTIGKALEMNPELKARYDENPQVAEVIDMSKALEGVQRHASTHAAGVVITKDRIDEYVPLYLSDKGISTQFTMKTIEELGLLKMDFLGLRTLTVIRDALEAIEKNHGVTIDFSAMEYDDAEVYRIISAGNTQGVFQLESAGMTQFMKNLRPDCFEDIIAGISLYRPGPMASIPTYIENKQNPDKVEYLHEMLEPILSVTYGCLIYQEQVMQIVRKLGGYSYGRSDLVRRVMSKKQADMMQQEKKYFIHGKDDSDGTKAVPGCIKNGIPYEVAEEMFNRMASFAEYAFNKSHAAAYAVIAYQTGYLKTHYPVEFMAALMTSVIGDSAQIAKYIRNCGEMGIEILPPTVVDSYSKFTVEDGKIRFGLLGIKGVGEGVIKAIINMRNEKGKPKDIFEFINNINIKEMNKKAVESLVKSGAMDVLNSNRAQLIAVYENLMESAQSNNRKNIEGQMSLFSMTEVKENMGDAGLSMSLPPVENFSNDKLIALEKEFLGVYITGHPLDDYAEKIKAIVSATTDDLLHADTEGSQIKDGVEVIMAGIINSKKNTITKSNRMMAFVDLEDLYGAVEVVVFPKIYDKYSSLLNEDGIVVVKGKINCKEDETPKLLADSILDINTINIAEGHLARSIENRSKSVSQKTKQRTESGAPKQNGAIHSLSLRITRDDKEEVMYEIRKILSAHKGNIPVMMYMADTGKGYKTDKALWVELSDSFMEEICGLLSKENVKIRYKED